jgi:hypothetical protein
MLPFLIVPPLSFGGREVSGWHLCVSTTQMGVHVQFPIGRSGRGNRQFPTLQFSPAASLLITRDFPSFSITKFAEEEKQLGD